MLIALLYGTRLDFDSDAILDRLAEDEDANPYLAELREALPMALRQHPDVGRLAGYLQTYGPEGRGGQFLGMELNIVMDGPKVQVRTMEDLIGLAEAQPEALDVFDAFWQGEVAQTLAARFCDEPPTYLMVGSDE